MSLNVNMLVLRSVSRGPVSSYMSNTFSSCSVSPLFLNLQNLSLLKGELLNKHVTLLRQTFFKTKNMSSLSATTLADESSEVSPAPKLTKQTANTLVMKLTSEERTTLLNTLQQFESEQLKAEYKGML